MYKYFKSEMTTYCFVCRFKNLAHAANIWQVARWLQPAPMQIVWKNSDAHSKPLSCALPGQVWMSSVSSHIYPQRQSAHSLQIQTSAIQSRPQEIWSSTTNYERFYNRLILAVLLLSILQSAVLLATNSQFSKNL